MSRLFRGRKLLAAALREFALAEGYVREESTKSTESAATKPLDLDAYRATKAKEGQR
jgi:hypothetical protein